MVPHGGEKSRPKKQETPEDEVVVKSAEPVIRSDVAAEEKEQQAEDPTGWARIREQVESKMGANT